MKKTVTIDEKEYVISPLNLEQVERYFPDSIPGAVATDESKDIFTRSLDMISAALTNAQEGNKCPLCGFKPAGGHLDDEEVTSPCWDRAAIKRAFNLNTIPLMQDEVLRLSGLHRRMKPANGTAEPGEAPASDRSSQQSEAVSLPN